MKSECKSTRIREDRRHKFDMIYVFIYAILIFPVFFSTLSGGVDSSWEYILNKISSFENIKFGSDVVSTYGPLGFLQAPMYINHRYIIAGIISLLYFGASTVLFWKLLRCKKTATVSIALSLFFVFIGGPSRAGELYVQYCAIMALAVLWRDMSDVFAAVFYVVSVTIAFFMKFTAAMAVIGSASLLLLTKLLLRDFRRLWILLIPCLTIPLFFMIYNPSWSGFIGYIRGGLELTKGYGASMSMPNYDTIAYLVFIIMGIYIAIIIDAFRHRNYDNGTLLIWMAPCLFIAYKHGFVRADIKHFVDMCAEIASLFSIVLLLFDFGGGRKSNRLQTRFILIVVGLFLMSYDNGVEPLQSLKNRFSRVPTLYEEMSEERFHENVSQIGGVPESILDVIGNDTFTSYPIEITFIEKNPETAMNYVPMATLQAYSTYTPYLDKLLAAQLSSDDAPRYIIFRFDTIDYRLPLIEVPATWRAIDDNYTVCEDVYEDGYFLLKRRSGAVSRESKSEMSTMQKTDVLTVEDCSEVRIYAKLNPLGRIFNMVWKIPEVTAKVTYTDGRIAVGRVLLDNLQNGIRVEALPNDYASLCSDMLSDGLLCGVRSIEFDGPGLAYYNSNFGVEKIRYQRGKHPAADEIRQTRLDLSGLTLGESGEAVFCIDAMRTTPSFSCYGWALISEQNEPYSAYVRIQGRYYKCVKLNGQDVIDYYAIKGDPMVRFQVYAPEALGDDGVLLLISGDTYYEFPLSA